MPDGPYMKGACRRCRGHVEFPLEAVGQTVPCPHCGEPTELAAAVWPAELRRKQIGWWPGFVIVLVALVVAGTAILIFLARNHGASRTTAGTLPETSAKAAPASAAEPPPANAPAETLTNGFALSPFTLDKAPGSSLVYVTGAIRNAGVKQRFGLKVNFALFDTNGEPVGKASDYRNLLEPDGTWHFKALVIESKAASARLDSIQETQ